MADTMQVPVQVMKPECIKQEERSMGPGMLAAQRMNNMHGRPRGRLPRTIHRPTPAELPLEEAAKREMQALPSKTPVSVLQELLSRRGTTPKYELVQVEGAIHEPTFRYRVTVADVVAMGIGRSKKEAKHAAAKNVLDKLIGNTDPNMMNSMSNSINDQLLTGNMVSPYEDKIGGNPIGLLQELCMSRRWPPPTYQTEHEEGLPHERQFTIACVVFKFKEIGTGKSKKLAKRQAANKMWNKLKDINVESNNISFNLEDEEELTQRVSQIGLEYADLKEAKISTLTTAHSHKVSQFHKNLKSSYGEKLSELQTVVLRNQGFNFVQFLQEIASEQQFEVTYVDIEEKSVSGKYQCLVQLSTLPVAVCHGSGTTSKEAQTAAAHNALEYLKIMTKK
ncbi:interferon-inducible double-stranded RNA-dependent protein kinase activator A homolog isoform X1 [Macrosteles quadrilineatus]|uniref:interferon-inducible double-stranded RNA-dependent protein kinase activator A homolog isoform X1 n=2 Tax=Macrosteles quadrilineatus TaxID=74068 RepID=UPI0023E10E5E|nr:interferon-inducible double-stranded RNA-dependent protein kinase activator A homolog isoform X1 [Macrosteles quadrilineatus]XP_054287262.1 interferon-inducible double-stranded RNA-dependent protein kinase activator A homolog isoform X1 [Macrosteles quadrilineatus]